MIFYAITLNYVPPPPTVKSLIRHWMASIFYFWRVYMFYSTPLPHSMLKLEYTFYRERIKGFDVMVTLMVIKFYYRTLSVLIMASKINHKQTEHLNKVNHKLLDTKYQLISFSNKKVDLMLCFDHIFNVRLTNGRNFI